MSDISKSKKDGMDLPGAEVDYNVTLLNDCDHPTCNSRRKYGVEVVKKEPNTLFGFINVGYNKVNKQFCPKHRNSVPESKQAIMKEHKEAKKEWAETKEKRQSGEFNKIINSNLIPKIRYSDGHLKKSNNPRFDVRGFENYQEAVEYLERSKFEFPILLHNGHDVYSLIRPTENDSDTKIVNKELNISHDSFKKSVSKVSIPDRRFYSVTTNCLTGMSYETPVNEIEKHIDRVIEWREYRDVQGYLRPRDCHICGSGWSDFYYSRIIKEGEETIIVSHSRCEKIIGELNTDLVSKKAYDILD